VIAFLENAWNLEKANWGSEIIALRSIRRRPASPAPGLAGDISVPSSLERRYVTEPWRMLGTWNT
jgi:hypothetical protein